MPTAIVNVLLRSSLKSLDLVTMKALDSKVNIIPVVAKVITMIVVFQFEVVGSSDNEGLG